jgi:16S rRNA (adenine1518-N6/adenine1519-N6)-dimethyltransferase
MRGEKMKRGGRPDSHSAKKIPGTKKSLGQHFLRLPDTARRIVKLLDIGPQDRVLEIGPGAGALSGLLRDAEPALLVLLEKDARWALERRRAGDGSVVLADAARFAWERISADRPWKIVGNLPYNIASVIIWDAVSLASGMERAVFMVQKEVALRLAALPGGKRYGALSVWAQSFTRPSIVFSLGPEAFTPPPKVDSALVYFAPLPPEQRPRHPEALAALLGLCFQNRRKQLRSLFKMHTMPHALPILEQLGIDPQKRPETLEPALFQELSARIVLTRRGKNAWVGRKRP